MSGDINSAGSIVSIKRGSKFAQTKMRIVFEDVQYYTSLLAILGMIEFS